MKIEKFSSQEQEKTIIQAKIDIITEDINKINSKIQTYKRIITKSEKGKKESVLINNRISENQQINEQENSINKNKDKKRVIQSTIALYNLLTCFFYFC